MSRKSYKRHDRFFIVLIMLLCFCAAALVLALVVQSRMDSRHEPAVHTAAQLSEGTPEPLTVVSVDSQLTPTPGPDATPSPTPAPTMEPFEYLPIYNKADTDEKMIAITLDDCSYIDALKYAATAANKYGAKLTLLPIADKVLRTESIEAMRFCVNNLGYQIENRTLSNSSLYALSDFQMASEIWTADTAVDYALGLDYGMHLLRTKGGQGLQDPRTHAYLKQLGYDGLLTWSVSGTDFNLEQLKNSLAPGNIYLFNCTKDDVIKLAQFMQFAQNRGYKMVTVNELLGFPENSMTPTDEDIMARQLPALEEYSAPVIEYTDGSRAYGVYELQLMLMEMGYLVDPNAATPTPVEGGTPMPTKFLDSVAATANLADGVFGQTTRAGIMNFQAERGLPCTGLASVEMQLMIRQAYADFNADK